MSLLTTIVFLLTPVKNKRPSSFVGPDYMLQNFLQALATSHTKQSHPKLPKWMFFFDWFKTFWCCWATRTLLLMLFSKALLSTYFSLSVKYACKNAFHACKAVSAHKSTKYQLSIHHDDTFLPCVIETFGAYVPDNVSTLLDKLSVRCDHRRSRSYEVCSILQNLGPQQISPAL